jgi:hypothetical protein
MAERLTGDKIGFSPSEEMSTFSTARADDLSDDMENICTGGGAKSGN